MDESDLKADLHRYLRAAREAVLWKLDALSESDIRRPLTRTGTNLLGLVKHLGGIEVGYFGDTFGRPFDEPLPAGFEEDAEPNAEFWATAAETRERIAGFYRRACAHADATIDTLGLDAIGHVPWWGDQGEVRLHTMLVHVLAETNRHAGHADIVRELIDGTAGLQPGHDNLPSAEEAWWQGHRDRLERIAQESAMQDGAS
ncbi:MAG TPA: DinB family protein [Streptosporangiaceae bacterium]